MSGVNCHIQNLGKHVFWLNNLWNSYLTLVFFVLFIYLSVYSEAWKKLIDGICI